MTQRGIGVSLFEPHDPDQEYLRDRIVAGLPETCWLVPVTAAADLRIVADNGDHGEAGVQTWLIGWDDGSALRPSQTAARAATRRNAILSVILAERSGDDWVRIASAALSAVPGDIDGTLARARDRAARLVSRTLRSDADAEASVALGRRPGSNGRISPAMHLRLRVRRALDRLSRLSEQEHWAIGWVDAPIGAALSWHHLPPVRWLTDRRPHRYLADPFGWPGRHDGLLCEVFDRKTGLGRIASLTVRADGTIADETAIAMPLTGHLSFPFVFEHAGQLYCLPESSAARRLCLLRWDAAEKIWCEHSVVLDGVAAADSVLFLDGDHVWIAYTDVDIDPFDNLNLCFARSLSGPWSSHPGNPVVLDPRRARCAGGLFRSDGSLYRPAQDCSETYGGAVRIMRITACTPSKFREEEVAAIRPEPGLYPDGFHTLTAWGTRCLVDGKRLSHSPLTVFRKAWRRLARLLRTGRMPSR